MGFKMINMLRWFDDAYEITMENNSYYFCHKMCVAFRQKGDSSVYVRGLCPMHLQSSVRMLVEALGHSAELKYMATPEFDCALTAAYSKSLIRGVSRVGIDRFFKNDKIETRRKNVKNVINE
jgi:hypothetical protein